MRIYLDGCSLAEWQTLTIKDSDSTRYGVRANLFSDLLSLVTKYIAGFLSQANLKTLNLRRNNSVQKVCGEICIISKNFALMSFVSWQTEANHQKERKSAISYIFSFFVVPLCSVLKKLISVCGTLIQSSKR